MKIIINLTLILYCYSKCNILPNYNDNISFKRYVNDLNSIKKFNSSDCNDILLCRSLDQIISLSFCYLTNTINLFDNLIEINIFEANLGKEDISRIEIEIHKDLSDNKRYITICIPINKLKKPFIILEKFSNFCSN